MRKQHKTVISIHKIIPLISVLKCLEKLYRKSLKKVKMTNFLFGNHAQTGGVTNRSAEKFVGKEIAN